MDTFERVETFEEIGPHLYKVNFVDGPRELKMVWVKTNAILKTVVGLSTDLKSVLLALVDGDKKEAIEKAIDGISMSLINSFFNAANDIANIAMDEYDDRGKLIRRGDVTMMYPEDVKAVLDMVIYDVVGLLKNVLRPALKTQTE